MKPAANAAGYFSIPISDQNTLHVGFPYWIGGSPAPPASPAAEWNPRPDPHNLPDRGPDPEPLFRLRYATPPESTVFARLPISRIHICKEPNKDYPAIVSFVFSFTFFNLFLLKESSSHIY